MNYWLLKSEPSSYSIDDLQRDKVTPWSGVRNYQARNFMREMKVGDLCFFYNSNCAEIGISGIGKVKYTVRADDTAFDPKSTYYDPKSTKEKPIWECPDISFVRKFKRIIRLKEIKSDSKLKDMFVVQKGSRLSVQPVSKKEFEYILTLE